MYAVNLSSRHDSHNNILSQVRNLCQYGKCKIFGNDNNKSTKRNSEQIKTEKWLVELVRNVMAHAQKPDLVFQRNGRVHLNRRGCQFSRLLALEECGSADSNCIDRAPSSSAKLLATHSIRIFPLHFPSRASPCAIRFRTRYTADFRLFCLF